MIVRKKFLFACSGVSVVAALTAVAVIVGPARANKTPVTPQQLAAYEQVFMDEVKKGDLLFHGDEPTAKQILRDVPSFRLRHSSAGVPEVPGEHEQVRNAARHDQLVHREAQPRRED